MTYNYWQAVSNQILYILTMGGIAKCAMCELIVRHEAQRIFWSRLILTEIESQNVYIKVTHGALYLGH